MVRADDGSDSTNRLRTGKQKTEGARVYDPCSSPKAENDCPVSPHKSLASEKLMMAHAEKR